MSEKKTWGDTLKRITQQNNSNNNTSQVPKFTSQTIIESANPLGKVSTYSENEDE